MLINSQHLQWDVRGSKVVFRKKLMMGQHNKAFANLLGRSGVGAACQFAWAHDWTCVVPVSRGLWVTWKGCDWEEFTEDLEGADKWRFFAARTLCHGSAFPWGWIGWCPYPTIALRSCSSVPALLQPDISDAEQLWNVEQHQLQYKWTACICFWDFKNRALFTHAYLEQRHPSSFATSFLQHGHSQAIVNCIVLFKIC